MPRGGARIGAGRKPGSKVTKTSELAIQAGAEGLSPVELLLGVVRDESQPMGFRAQCAGIVLPYVTPRLSSVQVERKSDHRVLNDILERIKIAEMEQVKPMPCLIDQL